MLPPVTLVNTKGRSHDPQTDPRLCQYRIPTLTCYYNDQGEYVGGEGDILAAYVAKALIWSYDEAPDLGDRDMIFYLTGVLDQAMDEMTMVCKALETGDATT